jgi:glycosyltransferase involved in cell wall biosynthesis
MAFEKNRTILHVDTERGWRGGEAQVLLLCQGLRRQGFRPLLVCQPKSLLAKRASAVDIPFRELPMRSEYDLGAIWRLRQMIRREAVRLCHAHTAHAHTLLWLATMGTGARLLVSRRVDFAVAGNVFSRRKYLSPRVHFAAISTGVKRVLRDAGIPEERIAIVPSGIDVGKFHRADADRTVDIRSEFHIPPGARIVGNIAHLADHKGHRYLIDAADIVIKEEPDVIFLIVGEGEERKALETQIARLGLQGKIILAGFRENVAAFLSAFDLFALSSHLEGLCTSLLDAMLAGVPVVTTRAGGVPDIIKDNENGLLVEPRNPAALAHAIVRLLRDREFAQRLARSARETVLRDFTSDKMVEGTIAVYDALAQS